MPDPQGLHAGQVSIDGWTTKTMRKGIFFQAGQWAALSSFRVRKNGILVENGRFLTQAWYKPVIRGKNTNMWPLLNNSREFSVLRRKQKQWKGKHFFLKKEHTKKGISYDCWSTLFKVCFAILCSSVDRYQVDQQAPPLGLTVEMSTWSNMSKLRNGSYLSGWYFTVCWSLEYH